MTELNKTSFRPAKLEDLQAILALLNDDPLGKSREDVSVPLNPAYIDAFRAIDADPNQLQAVADEAGQVVGCLQISFIPGLSRTGLWRGQIEAVRVAASHRGQGLGERMMAWAIEQCRQRGCGLVQLTTDTKRSDAHRFYERLGFAPSHIGMKLVLNETSQGRSS